MELILFQVIQGILLIFYIDLCPLKSMIVIYYKYKKIEIIYQVIDFSLFLDYTAFVPGIKSEYLLGKKFGKISLLSSTRSHYKG